MGLTSKKSKVFKKNLNFLKLTPTATIFNLLA